MERRKKYTVQYLNNKAPEKIKPKTLLITACTAVTVALISTKLTNTVSSVTLVAIASFLTAFVSEGYRISLELFHRAVQKQLNTFIDNSELSVADTGELQLIEHEPITPPIVEHSYAPLTPFGVRNKIRKVLTSRWAYTLVFACVGLATVLGSFSAGSLFQDNNYSITQVKPTKDISASKQSEIEAQAATTANDAAAQAKEDATSESASLIFLTRDQLQEQITSLQTTIDELTKTNSDYEEENQTLTKQIEALTEQLAALEERISALETASEEPSTPPNDTQP